MNFWPNFRILRKICQKFKNLEFPFLSPIRFEISMRAQRGLAIQKKIGCSTFVSCNLASNANMAHQWATIGRPSLSRAIVI